MGENPLFSGFALKWLIRKKEKGEKWENPLPLEAKLRGSGYLILKRSEIGGEKNLSRLVITHIQRVFDRRDLIFAVMVNIQQCGIAFPGQ